MACAHGICNYTLTHTYELYAATQKKMNWIVLHCNRRRSYSAFLIVYFTIWRVWRLIIKELSLRCDFLCLALLLLLHSNSTDILLVSTRYYYIFFAPNRKIKAKCRFARSLVFFYYFPFIRMAYTTFSCKSSDSQLKRFHLPTILLHFQFDFVFLSF